MVDQIVLTHNFVQVHYTFPDEVNWSLQVFETIGWILVNIFVNYVPTQDTAVLCHIMAFTIV